MIPRSIADAKRSDLESQVHGYVTQFCRAEEGYTGIVKDHSESMLFTLDDDSLLPAKQEIYELAENMLHNSLRWSKPLEFEGVYETETGKFKILRMCSVIGRRKYQVPQGSINSFRS